MDKKDGGFTLVEVMVSLAILGISTLTIFAFLGSMARQTANVKHQTFATQKTIQIMEELRSLIGSTDRIGILDNYDDGTACLPYLTTADTEELGSDPANPLSGNIPMGPNWKYLRQISVVQQTSDPYMRKVYIKIYLADESNPTQPGKLLAQSVSVIKTSVAGCVSTQVMDVYFLCLENIPGWWTTTATLKPMMDELISDIQTRNPGLEIRPHWITRLSYGRDPYYAPWTNEAVAANSLADIPFVNYYPGLVTKDDGAQEYYYVPEGMAGRINIDGTISNLSSYALADQYNNAVRYPQEEAMYAAYCAEAQVRGEAIPEISLRMLIEEMNSNPSDYKNAIVVNLHGELLPLPPIRNYSDAAKNPSGNPNVRVVTHPENLEYSTAPGAVTLRVYSYVTNPDAWAHDSTLGSITICFPDKNLMGSISVQKCEGNSVTDYVWNAAAAPNSYTLSLTADGTTVLTLFNSPLRHIQNSTTNRGLAAVSRLYGLEYIPCAIHPAGTPSFTYELPWNNPNVAKNTARWKIQISGTALSDGMYTVDTRMGSGTSGEYPNFSRTYFWVGVTPPITEQYQFIGDPRHCPYLDTKGNDGYNWFFTNIPAGDYQGYNKTYSVATTQPGWTGFFGTGVNQTKLNVDIPRFFQIYRRAMLVTNGIFTPITGWSFYYVGLGGELGADGSSGFANGLQIIRRPWSTTGSTGVTGINEIENQWAATGYGESCTRIVASTDNSWYSRYWTGELFPDYMWAGWQANGNLPTSTGTAGAATFYRAKPVNFGLPFNSTKMTSIGGCMSWFNGEGTATRPFAHEGPSTSNGVIVSEGNIMAAVFNYPPVTPLDANRPFIVGWTGSASDRPPEWNDSTYNAASGQRTALTAEKTYYTSDYSSGFSASQGVKFTLGTDAGYMVVQGLKPQSGFGAAQISRLALQGMLHQFLTAGEPTVTTGRIVQLPYLTVSSPYSGQEFTVGAGDTMSIQWSNTWKRWDGEKYTSSYADGFEETENVVYNVKYSTDNGLHWYHVVDGAVATVGVREDGPFSSRLVTSPLTWDVGSTAINGTCLLRVEAYRQTLPRHYSYQLLRLYVWR